MKQTTKRKLAMESLEDRKLMTVMTEFAEIGRLDQIASEYGAEPAAEVAAEKQVSSRLDLHNNGAFRSPGGHIIWNVADDSETNTGTLEEIAKSQKNDAAYIKFDGIMDSANTGTLEEIAKSQKNDAAYIKFDGIMASANTGTLEEIAKSQKNDAAYIKFDGIMASADTGTLEEIARSQKNDAAYIKFDGIMGASKTPNPHVAIDQLFSLVGEGERSFMAKDLWG
jgi:hypothetical protein